ncbi:MAG: ABC transporter ATP-binding protein [Lysobacter sp.]|nr:ABC transporter ATP-binding protein [Lysobacter sp.]
MAHAVAETAIVVDGIGKCYQIYARPRDRLIEALLPRVQRVLGLTPSRFFQEGWALRDASFRVERGETVGIIGRNGSGKSTLLQMVCGTLTPTLGSARVSGRVAALLELGSGFNPEYTGRENVYMNGTILGMSTAEIDAKFDSIAAFAEIGDFIERPVKTYSSGMYVRLAFAVIAHADADILVIDEALSVGDVFFAQKCMRFLRDFQARGTVLFVSHSAAAVVNLCDRAIWLDKGRLVMDGPAKAVCEAYHASTYGIEPPQAAQAATPVEAPAAAAVAVDADDARLDASRIRVFAFDPRRAGFGDGRAVVRAMRCEGDDGRVLQQVEGGEVVRLVVEAEALDALDSVIIGFFVKDRLGQHLFGKNTWREGAAPVQVLPGARVRAVFEFRMPYLPGGAYTVDVAIADGSPDSHVQLAWLFDALALESISSTVSTGLVGIPFRSVTLGASA